MATILRSIDLIHPIAQKAFITLQHALDVERQMGRLPQIAMFETYRSPERQNELFRRKKTKARAFESAHQFGLAVDFVPLTDGGDWKWEGWDPIVPSRLHELCTGLNLHAPIVWDPFHIEHVAFTVLKRHLRPLTVLEPSADAPLAAQD